MPRVGKMRSEKIRWKRNVVSEKPLLVAYPVPGIVVCGDCQLVVDSPTADSVRKHLSEVHKVDAGTVIGIGRAVEEQVVRFPTTHRKRTSYWNGTVGGEVLPEIPELPVKWGKMCSWCKKLYPENIGIWKHLREMHCDFSIADPNGVDGLVYLCQKLEGVRAVRKSCRGSLYRVSKECLETNLRHCQYEGKGKEREGGNSGHIDAAMKHLKGERGEWMLKGVKYVNVVGEECAPTELESNGESVCGNTTDFEGKREREVERYNTDDEEQLRKKARRGSSSNGENKEGEGRKD